MTSPSVMPPDPEPARTPQAIRDALVGAERVEFEQQMATATDTLDLTVLATYRPIAEITRRQGADSHLRMLEQAARLERGEDVPTVPGSVHKAEINTKLGR